MIIGWLELVMEMRRKQYTNSQLYLVAELPRYYRIIQCRPTFDIAAAVASARALSFDSPRSTRCSSNLKCCLVMSGMSISECSAASPAPTPSNKQLAERSSTPLPPSKLSTSHFSTIVFGRSCIPPPFLLLRTSNPKSKRFAANPTSRFLPRRATRHQRRSSPIALTNAVRYGNRA